MKNFSDIPEGLTYDDVLLVPKRSSINSRKEVDLSVKLAGNITLKLPIVSAPMDTVTESKMAIALARMGALGIIHRFNSIETQVQEVSKVKRVENYFLENPFSLSPKATLKELLDESAKLNHSSFLVTDENNTLLGIISKRDYGFETDMAKTVQELMTPFEKLIYVKDFVGLEEAKQFFKTHKIEKLPIIDENNKVKGLITAKDVVQNYNQKAVRDGRGRLLVGAALGVKSDFLDRAKALVTAGVDVLVLDIAHGHLEKCLETIKILKKEFPEIPLIVGNIATEQGAKDLREAGADVIKVGVGPGAACTTRIVTGFGMPQLTAIMEAVKGAGDIPVIADGGAKSSGDLVKALAAGATAVMIGNMLAGSDETPGKLVMWNGRKVKQYRGMASFAAYDDKQGGIDQKDVEDFTAEGVDQGFVASKGPVKDLLKQWEGGMRSGFSYGGAHNIAEFWENAEFIKMSAAGAKESGAHDITTT